MPATTQFASMPAKVGVPSLAPVKKQRRRRSAAAGAADDCHACRARKVKCDRQRPYCQQCLDMGKDCSGYKQALTWGQGIASRGHLRGLSSPAAPRTAVKAEDRRTRPRRPLSSSPMIPSSRSSPNVNVEGTTPSLQLDAAAEDTLSPQMISPSCLMPMHTPDWQLPSPPITENFGHMQTLGKSYEVHDPFLFVQRPMTGLQVPQAPRLGTVSEYSGSLSSASGVSEMDWPSPSEYPQTPDPAASTSARIQSALRPYLCTELSSTRIANGAGAHLVPRFPVIVDIEWKLRGWSWGCINEFSCHQRHG